ncbi:hypothetical protein L484_014222 [Morus notabilis]|uniref:Pentatricopeptide repeat-containing protein n=1 Tax=Morus notabilis TaxID=981085 RepID=W9RS44_9ROSA|nr:pentatricopeptide repeat-containing protein At4g21190 [Morus notabilis]XP_024027565.1 pentatricopeptide repeat-containing protein At4g21190 [Morus notabilis]XP_024027566.1 pentatricopeptide repeat-containing protein At4g21190 [Morus notabilis]EXC05953.1 hypothetical protein L484_014222 [Morus notabilis]
MLALRCFPPVIRGLESLQIARSKTRSSVVVCAAKGPRPRYARVWKTNKRIGTVSKSAKFVQSIKELSNVKEEVYGALDSLIAWELEFPLITVKKAIKTLEEQKEWKRIIQVTKWMLSKGQGKTMGTYFILLNALAEDGRLEEAEELWTKLFSENLESTPRNFFNKMISIYYHRRMHDQMFEIFADMEELGIRPNVSIVTMVGKVFLELGMLDKHKKLKRKYPLPKWEYRYIRGKRIRIRAKDLAKYDGDTDRGVSKDEESEHGSDEPLDIAESSPNGSDAESEEVDPESNDVFEEAEMSTDESQS